MDNYC